MITDESLKYQSRPKTKTETPCIEDNLCEVLLKIVKFTQSRQKILARNIHDATQPRFVPKDLPCTEFANILNVALDEHVQQNRLLLVDTDNIKFLGEGSFETKAVVDSHAKHLLETSTEEYLQYQVQKLLENSLSQRFAAQLLKERQESPL